MLDFIANYSKNAVYFKYLYKVKMEILDGRFVKFVVIGTELGFCYLQFALKLCFFIEFSNIYHFPTEIDL